MWRPWTVRGAFQEKASTGSPVIDSSAGQTWETTAATTLASRTMATVSSEEKLAPELSGGRGRPASSFTAPGRCSTDSTAKKTPEMGALKPAATPDPTCRTAQPEIPPT